MRYIVCFMREVSGNLVVNVEAIWYLLKIEGKDAYGQLLVWTFPAIRGRSYKRNSGIQYIHRQNQENEETLHKQHCQEDVRRLCISIGEDSSCYQVEYFAEGRWVGGRESPKWNSSLVLTTFSGYLDIISTHIGICSTSILAQDHLKKHLPAEVKENIPCQYSFCILGATKRIHLQFVTVFNLGNCSIL